MASPMRPVTRSVSNGSANEENEGNMSQKRNNSMREEEMSEKMQEEAGDSPVVNIPKRSRSEESQNHMLTEMFKQLHMNIQKGNQDTVLQITEK